MRFWKAYAIALGLMVLVGAAKTVPYQLWFQAPGVGSVLRYMSAKLFDRVDVGDYLPSGFVTDGSVDYSTQFQNAFTSVSSGGTIYMPPGTYSITSQLSVTAARVRVVGYGTKLVQSGTLQRGITMSGARDVLEGVWIYNTHGNTEYADAPAGSTNAIGVYVGTGCDGCKVLNTTIEQFGYAQIRVYQSKYVVIDGNELIGVGATLPLVAGQNNNLGIEGYLSGSLSEGLRVTNNSIHDLAQGILTSFDWKNVVIQGNVIRDIQGQHGMYLDNAVNLSVIGNTVTSTGQNGIKIQISANATLDPENNSIIGNTIDSPGAAGIIVLPASGGLTPRFKQVTIVGNTIRNPAASGISVDQADNFLIGANAIRNATTFGIITGTASGNGRINGNQILTTQQTGIYGQATSTSFVGSIENNTLDGTCAAGSGASDLRAVIYMGSGKWVTGDNFILNDGSCGSDLNVGASAIAILRRNFPGSKNNVMSGTATAEGLTTNTTGSNGVTVTPNLNTTTHLFETVTFPTWTVGAPTNVNGEAFLIVTVANASGGAITTTWNANLHLAGAWVDPLNGFNRSVWFKRNNNLYYEIDRSPADVAN